MTQVPPPKKIKKEKEVKKEGKGKTEKKITVPSNLKGSKSQNFPGPLAPTIVGPSGDTAVAESL